jgi:dipeptidyl aminopeptidase/acylaminoacyl peptidase
MKHQPTSYIRRSPITMLVFLLMGVLVLVSACTSQFQPPGIEEITYQSGEFSLACDIRLPGGKPPYPVILIVQGSVPTDRTEGSNYLPVFERMLNAGYAVFACDGPGIGESTDTIDDLKIIHQRAQMVLDAIEVMKNRHDIDPDRIGLAGVSQAGYVQVIPGWTNPPTRR